ncbi:MAG: 4-(cytidine 5'-diphospho)-2-C-methyl-D-erythritol kinase [Thermoleophilia bacterium]
MTSGDSSGGSAADDSMGGDSSAGESAVGESAVGDSAGDRASGEAAPVAGRLRLIRAPAKVNLSLLVGPPYDDGYHPLSTVFVPLSLADEVEVDLEVRPRFDTPGTSRSLEVVCPGIAQEENLVTRAVRAVERATGWAFSGRLTVRKNIPKGAGLGGGSSDAAVALRAAAQMVAETGGPRLSQVELHRIARSLGADVPFFLDPRPALAVGVGDLLEPLELPPLPLALLLPTRELSAAEVYRTFDGVGSRETAAGFEERRLRAERAWRALSAAWASGALDAVAVRAELAGLLGNDLEISSLHLVPELAADRADLDGEGVLGVLMSGSGPTLFGLCATMHAAEAVVSKLRARGHAALAVCTGEGPPMEEALRGDTRRNALP